MTTKIDTNENNEKDVSSINIVTENGIVTDPVFDESEFCDKEIFPLMKELHEKCVAHKIPMILNICKARSSKRRSFNGSCRKCTGSSNTFKISLYNRLYSTQPKPKL